MTAFLSKLVKARFLLSWAPNGAGKTTTVEILECLRPLTSGSAKLFGYDAAKKDEVKKIQKSIGVLTQDSSTLDKLTVKENIDFIGDRYEKLLHIAGITKLLDLEDKQMKSLRTIQEV